MKNISKISVFCSLLSSLLIGLCGSVYAGDVEVEEEVFYKVWENESLYPSLSHYLNVAQTVRESGDILEKVERDSFLTGVL